MSCIGVKGVRKMDDEQIVQLYWDRNERAIEESSTKYGSYCRNIARNILQSNEDAEECVNDTWLTAWNTMPPHKPSVLSAFLGKLTRNLSFDRYRTLHREKRGGHTIDLVLDELEELVSGQDDPERRLLEKELMGSIDQFLQRQTEEKRNLFILRYWYALDISEISGKTGLSCNHISVSLSRTRRKLKTFLNERGYAL